MQFLDLEHSPWNRSGHACYLTLDMCRGEDDTVRVSQHVWVTPGQRTQEISSLTALPRHLHTAACGGRNEALRKWKLGGEREYSPDMKSRKT